MQIVNELRKRKVFTSAVLYVPLAWITTEVLTFLFAKFAAPAWTDDLVAAAFVAGFPAAIILAWTFDLGPGGITRTSAGRAQGYVAMVLATLIMGIGTAGLFFQIQSSLPESAVEDTSADASERPVESVPVENSIAVYPFENQSSDPENDYFSEGMTSELITRLSQIKGLRIAAIAQTKDEVLALGLEPDVRYRLEGSIRKAGNTVRITALLTDRRSGFTVWSEEFPGNLEDVFALQEHTARSIAEALGVKLSPGESIVLSARGTDNLEAYDAFLRGWSLLESLHLSFEGAAEKLQAARRNFEQALIIDPGYTQAVAGLSMVTSNNVFLGFEPKEHLQSARRLADEALALDSTRYEPHFAMARALANDGDSLGAVTEYRKVVELDSQNGYAWCEMSAALNAQDPVGAEAAAREAIRFRPAYSVAYYTLGAALEKQGRLSVAIDAYQQSLQLDPGNVILGERIERLRAILP